MCASDEDRGANVMTCLQGSTSLWYVFPEYLYRKIFFCRTSTVLFLILCQVLHDDGKHAEMNPKG
jgi:hypothetical protein